jgi:hypothetical protein
MTRLFNLESYVECCQYGYTFGQDPKALTPSRSNYAIPIAYKTFFQRYGNNSFFTTPGFLDQQPEALQARSLPLADQVEKIGVNLKDNYTDKYLYIVREVNSLILRSLQAEYLYANVFHYWNSVYCQLPIVMDKPIVIYDFSSFTPEQITPFTLQSHHHFDHPIPIIDTRDIKAYDSLKLPAVKYEIIYDNICLELAGKILERLNLNPNYRVELSHYLKKINVYDVFKKFPEKEELPLILLIDNFYYTYTLSTRELSDLTLRNLPIDELRETTHQHKDFQYICLGHYTALAKVREYLSDQTESHVLVASTDLKNQSFQEIWRQRQKLDFPLYGQHLDRITFFVKRSGETTDISLPQRICYDGEDEITIYGQYHDINGVLKEDFPLSIQEVTLPFHVNGEDYLNDQGETQTYAIENQFFADSPNLDIKIGFRLKPGFPPKLEVIDSHKNRRLKSQLISDHTSASSQVGYIPVEDVRNRRQKISTQAIDFIETSEIINKFSHLLTQLSVQLSGASKKVEAFLGQSQSQSSHHLEEERIYQNLEVLSQTLIELKGCTATTSAAEMLSVYILPYQPSDKITSLQRLYLNLDLPSKYIQLIKFYEKLRSRNIKPGTSNSRKRELVRQVIQNLLLFLGKSYAIASSDSSQTLFDNADYNSCWVTFDIYWQSLARLSSQKRSQICYFNFFLNKSSKTGHKFYKSAAYLWGYSRILLWYLNFDEACSFLPYKNHFDLILNQMLSLDLLLNASRDYLRDGLIALIYLLSFREYDSSMVAIGSNTYTLSKQLCDHLRKKPIRTQKIAINASLNDFFETLLDGVATEENAKRLLEIE